MFYDSSASGSESAAKQSVSESTRWKKYVIASRAVAADDEEAVQRAISAAGENSQRRTAIDEAHALV